MQQMLDRVLQLIRARYPILQLVTHEEERVVRALERLADQEGLALHQWRSTTGLVGPELEFIQGGSAATVDLSAALDAIGLVDEPAMFVLLDVHPYLERPAVIRRIQDRAIGMGQSRQVMVFVGCNGAVPSEFQKEVTVLDVPLPGRDEVGKLLGVLLKSQRIEIEASRFERFVNGSLGLTEREIKRLYARIALSGKRFSESDLVALIEEKRQVIRRSRFLEFCGSPERIDEVGGMDSLKKWLEQRSRGFSEKAREFGLPEPKGLFLLGVQGCGKSMMAKAVADLWDLPLLRLDVSAVFQSSGREDESLRATVRVAESLAPVVLWIDELEKGFLSAADVGGGRAFGYFLTWMQEKQKPVFVVATANEVRSLPPELLRKGRFDEIFFVDLPNVHERLEILEIHLRRRSRDPDGFNLVMVAEETEKFSGAELEQVVVAAMFGAFSDDRELTIDDLIDTAREMIPLAVTMDDRLKELREWARPRARPASTDTRRADFFEDWEDAD